MSKKYKIEFTEYAFKQARKLPKYTWLKLEAIIKKLGANPLPPSVKSIRGYKNVYRIRFSTYRIVYSLDEGKSIILIIAIGHRKSIYRLLD
jgi:mRNA interferase RelE/StbE